MSNKVIEAQEAIRLIEDGDTITIGGILGIGYPEKIISALEISYLTTGEPRDLTLFEASPTGLGIGFEHLAHEGLLKRIIESWFTPFQELVSMIKENKVEGYCLPLGSLHCLTREIAAGRPFYLTKVGLNTAFDPRQTGGKLNSKTTEDLVSIVTIDGEEWMKYKAFPINVAIIRGAVADEEGNISLEGEPLTLGHLYQAMAAKNSGGTVIAQVKHLVARGSLPARRVEVPGFLVDAIVLEPKQAQNEVYPDRYIEGVDGEFKAPHPPVPVLPLDYEKVIARRAAMELRPGQVTNVGGGIPMWVFPQVTLEEDVQDLITFTVEHGAFGGINLGSTIHVNPVFLPNYQEVFDFYLGGGLDVTFLGFSQVDKASNVNSDRLGHVWAGVGGALDISYNTREVVLCGAMNSGGLEVDIRNGRPNIIREGKYRKLVDEVEWITLSGTQMKQQGKKVILITERAVFQMQEEGWELIEIAPGIELEKDVLQQMEFQPLIGPELKEMDRRLFLPQEMGLRKDLLGSIGETRIRPPKVYMEKDATGALLREKQR